MDGLNLSQGFSTNQTLNGNQTTNVQSGKEVILSQQNTILDLKVGDIFRGEIVAVGGEEVQLKLANDQLLAARMEGRVQLAIGQILGFQVQANENAKVILKPVYMNQMQVQVGEAALKTAGLAINEKSMQMITDMIENGLPIDKKGLMDVYRQILQHPDSSMHTIVQLNKLHIPVNESNISQFENYKELSYRIQDSASEFIDDVWNVLELLEEKNNKDSTVVYKNKTDGSVINNSDVSLTDEKNINNTKELPIAQKVLANDIFSGENTRNEVVNDSDQGKSYLEKIIKIFENDSVTFENDLLNKKQGPPNVEQGEASFGKINLTAQNIIETIKSNDMTMKQLSGVFSQEMLHELSSQETHKLFHSKQFRDLLETIIRNEWSMTPDDILKNGGVEEFYKRLHRQAAKLDELTSQVIENLDIQPKSIHNLKQNLDFMSDINQIFQYVQLPIKFSESHAHGELYVYTNKKNLAKKDGNLTAYLHLDMDHIGPVNVHISLDGERNSVSTKFEVTPDMIMFVSSYLGELDKRLEKLGYHVKSKISPLDATKTVIEQLEEKSGASNVTLSYQTFDMRA